MVNPNTGSNSADVTQRWLDTAEKVRGTDQHRVSHAAFSMMITGEAPNLEMIHRTTGLSLDRVKAIVADLATNGRLRLDADGTHIIGSGGLELDGDPNGLIIDGHRYGYWCALDAVGIPAGLGVDAVIEDRCADTGELVRIEIRAGRVVHEEPAGMVISLAQASLESSVRDTL